MIKKNNINKISMPLVIGIFSSIAVIVLSSVFSGIFTDWEVKTLDYRFRMRENLETHKDIVMLDCDDSSIEKLGRWPWRRSLHAKMINMLSSAGAKVIAYDILFSQPTDKEEDDALVNAVRRSKNVVLPVGIGFEVDHKIDPGDENGITENIKKFSLPKKQLGGEQLLKASRIISSLPLISDFAYGLGHISSNRDNDGTIRRTPLIVNLDGRLFPAFGLSAASYYLNITSENISVDNGLVTLKNKQNRNNIEIPVDTKAMMLINYAGRWVDTYNHYSFAQIIELGDSQEGRQDLKNIFAGKICLISNTATGFDIEPIPMEKDYPGGGIHANIINTIITNDFLIEVTPIVNIIILLVIGIISGFASLSDRWQINLISSLSLVIFHLGLSIIFFIKYGIVLNITLPLLIIGITVLIISYYRLMMEQKKMTGLTTEKDTLFCEVSSVNSKLFEKEEHLTRINKELGSLKGQIIENNKKSNHQLAKIGEMERRIKKIIEEKDQLEEKKEMLKSRLSDLEENTVIAPSLTDSDLEELRIGSESLGIITRNRTMLEIFKRLTKAAKTDSSILLLGESGTGKEQFANAVHKLSRRKNKDMVTVNLAAISEGLVESELFGHVKGAFTGAVNDKKGKFELANGGTIFLDEIGDMKLELQSRLLRVLQGGEIDPVGGNKVQVVDVRIISATNKNLKKEIEWGGFRSDLFSRLNVITVNLPPLRERPEDIECLADYFFKYFKSKYEKDISGISFKAMKRLKAHHWTPGNVRDLKNCMDRGITNAEGRLITEKDLGLPLLESEEIEADLREETKKDQDVSNDLYFLEHLRKNRFNMNMASKHLGLNRGTIASRFKGICFQYLVNNDLDIEKAYKQIAGNSNGELYTQAEKKIKEYYFRLVASVEKFENPIDAVGAYISTSKNFSQKYHPFVKEIIERYFRGEKLKK